MAFHLLYEMSLHWLCNYNSKKNFDWSFKTRVPKKTYPGTKQSTKMMKKLKRASLLHFIFWQLKSFSGHQFRLVKSHKENIIYLVFALLVVVFFFFFFVSFKNRNNDKWLAILAYPPLFLIIISILKIHLILFLELEILMCVCVYNFFSQVIQIISDRIRL